MKIEFENTKEFKELVEIFSVAETSNNNVVCFAEVESLDSCTEENAKNALDIIKKHKKSNMEKVYKEFYEKESVSDSKETNDSECICFICSKKIKNKEDVFKMPLLKRDYLNSSKKIEEIEICEKCLDANSWVIRKKRKHESLKNDY